MKTFATVLTLTTAAAIGGSVCNAAEVIDGVRMAEVRFADLDLSHSDGVARLYQRITNAASLVCERHGTRDIAGLAESHRCKAEATARAVAEVNAPALTRWSAEQSHRKTLGRWLASARP